MQEFLRQGSSRVLTIRIGAWIFMPFLFSMWAESTEHVSLRRPPHCSLGEFHTNFGRPHRSDLPFPIEHAPGMLSKCLKSYVYRFGSPRAISSPKLRLGKVWKKKVAFTEAGQQNQQDSLTKRYQERRIWRALQNKNKYRSRPDSADCSRSQVSNDNDFRAQHTNHRPHSFKGVGE